MPHATKVAKKKVKEPAEGIMDFMTLEKPKVKKSTPLSTMRKEFEKEKAKNPEKIERGELDRRAQQVYTKRSDEDSWSELKELSSELLGRYKKAAYADAKQSDADGNYTRGDKRFKGINKATNKQFDNDLKKHNQANEEAAGVGTITKQNTTVDVNKNTPRKNLKAFNLI
jgi:hypothetical protein